MADHGTNLIVGHDGGVMHIEFARPDLIDPEYLDLIEKELRGLVGSAEHPRVVLDFEEVRFLCSSAIGVILRFHQLLDQRDGRLCLANVVEEVRRVLELVSLPELVPIFADYDAAVRSLRN